MHLAWNPPADAGGAPTVGYRIYRSTHPGTATQAGFTDAVEYLDSPPGPPTLYVYAVTAINGAGEGPAAEVATMGGACIDIVLPPDTPDIMVDWYCLGVCPILGRCPFPEHIPPEAQ